MHAVVRRILVRTLAAVAAVALAMGLPLRPLKDDGDHGVYAILRSASETSSRTLLSSWASRAGICR